MKDSELCDTAIRLITDEDKSDLLLFEALPGGNNRLYRLDTKHGKYILKYYFRHDSDKRDRLNSEYQFCAFAWNHGIRCVARPIAIDHESSVGIYGFIEGNKFSEGDVTSADVSQALDFFRRLNEHRSSPDAVSLPNGSEACFSIREHIELIDSRVERLKAIEIKDNVDKEANEFIIGRLTRKWAEIKSSVISEVNASGISYDERISYDDMVISPSDFGFHNAIKGNNGRIYFIDFEYAGWDDPAKLSGDFFSQVAVPVPVEYFQEFTEKAAGCINNKEKTLMRMRLLLPAYRIKWCCIVLNHFIRIDRERKVFADRSASEKKTGQLEKAKSLLDSVDVLQFIRG